MISFVHQFRQILFDFQVLPKILRSFAGALDCSRASRPAFELLHISKSGGTSMCALAGLARLHNYGVNVDANCLVRQASKAAVSIDLRIQDPLAR